MLEITIPDKEYYDEKAEAFFTVKGKTLCLEHSLVSLSKWESKWHKPFLGKTEKTYEEMVDYIRCMTITQNVDPLLYNAIPADLIEKINVYLEDSMTATWFSKDQNQRPNHDVITAEIIYYWMISLQIPMECQKWHLNRLLTLIQVCNIKNAPSRKMSKKDQFKRNRALNSARKRRLNSNG